MKEKEKILIAKSLLKVTFIMISISLFLKLIGLNIMEADYNNKILTFTNDILSNYQYLDFCFNFLLIFTQHFVLFRIACENKNIKIYYTFAFIITIANAFFQWFLYYYAKESSVLIYYLVSFLPILLAPIIIDMRIKSKIILNKKLPIIVILKLWSKINKSLIILIIISIYQLVVMFLRNITYVVTYENIYNFLLNFDYIILLLITYYLFLKKEMDVKLKHAFDFALPKLFDEKPSIDSIRAMISNIQEKKQDFKETEKTEKLVIIIYAILFTLSELFNLALIIFIANINHAIVECLFVVSAFLITRQVFGAFHFDSAWKCWIVSNISFFILNKITLSAGLTIVIPILLGITLAYITSKFIKKHTTTPYRGMAEQELKDICRNKSLSKFEINLLIDFYCHRESIIKLTYKYSYSRAAIFIHKSNALKKIEA